MKLEDYAPESKQVYLSSTKSGKPRYVPLNSIAEEIIQGQIEKHGSIGFVFRGSGGRQMSPPYKAFQRIKKTAGIEGITPHSLRHTASSQMLMAGVGLLTVSRLLGHASPKITADYYGHLSVESMVSASSEMVNLMQEKVGGTNECETTKEHTVVSRATGNIAIKN